MSVRNVDATSDEIGGAGAAPPPPALALSAEHPTAGGPRSRRGRTLLWVGATIAVVAIAQGGYQAADWLSASTTVSSETHGALPAVDLTADGDVTVAVGSSDSIEIERRARSGFQDVRYEAVETDGTLAVEHSCPRWWSSGVCQADLVVTVPAGTEVVVRTGSGAVRVEGVEGDLRLDSGDGDVTVLRAGGRVDARTSSGRVEVDGARTGVVARSGDGDVTVRDAGGAVEARTSSGAVVVDGVRGDATVESGDGDVEAREVTGSASATTSSGAVRVGGVRGDVVATSGDGDVVVRGTGTPVALQISSGDGRSTVEAPTDPSASRTVTIRSSSGDVSYLGAE